MIVENMRFSEAQRKSFLTRSPVVYHDGISRFVSAVFEDLELFEVPTHGPAGAEVVFRLHDVDTVRTFLCGDRTVYFLCWAKTPEDAIRMYQLSRTLNP